MHALRQQRNISHYILFATYDNFFLTFVAVFDTFVSPHRNKNTHAPPRHQQCLHALLLATRLIRLGASANEQSGGQAAARYSREPLPPIHAAVAPSHPVPRL